MAEVRKSLKRFSRTEILDRPLPEKILEIFSKHGPVPIRIDNYRGRAFITYGVDEKTVFDELICREKEKKSG